MKLAPKDAQKVRQLHSEIMAIADKAGMSMEDLIDSVMEGEEPEMEDESMMEEESPAMDYEEEEEKPMDKAKIALIIGKMRRGAE
jgi:hypothetical protein